ncbi:MAG: iron-sulfur cluster assembly accessory protein [Cytophagales bacterium]|nr:MAG: iron-sulfur cluster assembly accessory protein [Cytophagales bacterium]
MSIPKPVTLSERAVLEVKRILEAKKIPQGYALRLVVSGGTGCGGARFKLGFDKPKPEDSAYEQDGVQILYEKRQMLFLIGLRIDFEERENEQGFVFVPYVIASK